MMLSRQLITEVIFLNTFSKSTSSSFCVLEVALDKQVLVAFFHNPS